VLVEPSSIVVESRALTLVRKGKAALKNRADDVRRGAPDNGGRGGVGLGFMFMRGQAEVGFRRTEIL